LRSWLEKFWAPLAEKMSSGEKVLFTTQLGSMLKTGLPVTRALEAFVDEKQTRMSLPIKRIMEQLRGGKSLSEALQSHPNVFDKIYVNVVRSGETMGKLAESLEYLGEQLKREHELKAKVKSALIYPIVVLVAMFGVMTFIALSVVPKIVVFAKNAGAELPQITQIIVAATEFIRQYWWFLILVMLGLMVGSWRLLKTRQGRKTIDGLLLKVPVVGELIKRYNQARFSRLLSGFYRYGISVEVAFDILTESLGNYHYSQACRRMKQRLTMGRSLSEVLDSERELFSGIIGRVVKGAEQTGVLDETLLKLALFYEDELGVSLNNLTTIIEPVLIMFLGVGVIGIALAVIVPIYRVTSQLR
jgi:type IV pilus assembly protein PilC